MKNITQPLKWHGGKHDLASWIISLMPPRCQNPNKPNPADPGWLHYVEPYFGGGSVLLAMDPEGISEVVNDLNGELTNFWQCLADSVVWPIMWRRLDATPFCENAWLKARGPLHALDAPVDHAIKFFIRCRQSLAGRMDRFAPLTRNRTRRGMNEQASAWLNAVEGLPAVHERLKRVVVLNRDALDVIRSQDGPRTLFYLDPPYLHQTRATTGEYEHEMSECQHRELLAQLNHIQGRFLFSGYHNPLYDDWAFQSNFACHEKAIHNHAAGGKTKRVMTECVWTNY